MVQTNIEVEHQQRILRALGADIAIKVLFRGDPKGVAIGRGVIGGKHAHPVFHVGQVFHAGHVVRRAIGIGGVHQRIGRGEIIGRIGRAADLKVVAIARRLLRPAGGGVGIECDPIVHVEQDRAAGRERGEFKPGLHFVHVAAGVVRKIFLHHVAVRHLGVFHKTPRRLPLT